MSLLQNITQESCGSFLLQWFHVFNLQPTSYASDQAKIAYTMNLLRGKAAQWATALWEAGSGALDSHEIFVTEMRRVFDHSVQGSEAATCLFSLRQGSQSAANYSIDFFFFYGSRDGVEQACDHKFL